MRRILSLVALLILPAATPQIGHAVELYDGPISSAPEDQGSLAYQSTGGSKTTAGGKTTLDTTGTGSKSPDSIEAGFGTYRFNPSNGTSLQVNSALPPLDRNAGYSVVLDLKVLSETHASVDRSGVDLIVISADTGGQKDGIELSFWQDHIWAQNSGFTHGEDVAYDTTLQKEYTLNVLGSSYALLANGSPILSGLLREYSGLPYTLPNFVFVGDDTTSARGSFEFSRLAELPEPGFLSVAVIAGGAAVRRRSNDPKRDQVCRI